MFRSNSPFETKLPKTSLKAAALLGVVGTLLATARPAFAQGTAAWSGVCVSGPDNDVATIQGAECLIANIFAIIITLIGMAGFAMMVIASFRYLASGGNTKHTEKSRNTFTYAVAGIVVALSAFIALRIVTDFTGINQLMEFRIPTSDQQYN